VIFSIHLLIAHLDTYPPRAVNSPIPAPAPAIDIPATATPKECEVATTTIPTIIKIDPMRVIFLRPKISPKYPENGATDATASVLQTGIQLGDVKAFPPRSTAI
jgi:hypothetical protein